MRAVALRCVYASTPAGAAIGVMEAWLGCNRTPYPTLAQRQMIASDAGITEKVVKFWFGNVRQRAWKVCVRAR
jgi:Homeodomain